MTTALKVEADKVRKLLRNLGLPSADEVPEAKLQSRLSNLPSLLEEAAELTDEDDRQLKEEILTALKEGRKVAVPAAEGGEAPKKAKGKKKAAERAVTHADNGNGSGRARFVPAGKAGGPGGPSITQTIIDLLREASSKSPLTRQDLLKKLSKKFPGRRAEGMAKTLSAQVPGQLRKVKKLTVAGDKDKGFWIPKK